MCKFPLRFPACLTGFVFLFFIHAQAQLPAGVNAFAFLQQHDSLSISIETDLKQLKGDKADEKWQPAVFKILKGDSVAMRLNVQVAARGNMRKKTCEFPPVKVRFYEQKPANDSLADINELKLVTGCDQSPQNDEWVRREYVLYELYNLVTEQSFRVKPAHVRFDDTQRKGRSAESFSFFIESEREMAARIGGFPMKPRVGSTRTLDSVSYDRMCLFEFMIGNTDWSARSRHNIKLVYLDGSGKIIAVPYDFDYAGAVGTNYAIPNRDYPIQTVQDRYYLGLCRSEAHYQQQFDFYLSKKSALLGHCERSAYLPANARRQMTNYFESFFKTLEDPRLARRDILKNCNKGR